MFGLLAAFSVLAAASTVAFRAWSGASRDFRPERRRPVTWPVDRPAVDGRMDFEVRAANGHAVRGWYLPSRNGVAVVLVHGRGADRRQLLGEAAALYAAGMGALVYDEPGCGDSDGMVTWGQGERDALVALVRWLRERAGIARVGVFGFSKGAYVAAQVSARHPDVHALALAGAVANFPDQTRHEFRRYGWLSQWPALRARERGGFSPADPQPEALIGAFKRPLFIVSGERDAAVPLEHSARLYRAAQDPKTWWIVPNAGHGDYALVSREYLLRLTAFFERALTPS